MAVPCGGVGAEVARQRPPPLAVAARVPGQVETEGEAAPGRAISEEREVEGAPVPRHDHAGVEAGQVDVEGRQDIGFDPGEGDLAVGRRDGGGDDRRHARVETVVARVGLDVEAVERGPGSAGECHCGEHTNPV